MKKPKQEIWVSEVKWSANKWDFCTKHFSRGKAQKAATKCQKSSGIKHRFRKIKGNSIRGSYGN